MWYSRNNYERDERLAEFLNGNQLTQKTNATSILHFRALWGVTILTFVGYYLTINKIEYWELNPISGHHSITFRYILILNSSSSFLGVSHNHGSNIGRSIGQF